MSVVRRLGGAAIIYGLGGVASRMVGVLMLPFLTRYLTPTDYGVVAMLGVVSSLLVGAVSLGTGNSMGICYHEARGASEKNSVIWTTAAIVFASALCWGGMGVWLSEWLSELVFGTDDYAMAVALGFGQLAASSAVVPLLGRWRLEERARAYTLATLGLGLSSALATFVVVVVFEQGVLGLLWASLGVQWFFALLLLFIHWRMNPARFRVDWAMRVIRLGWPSIFGVGAFFVIDFSGRIALEHFSGLHELGVFSVGLSFGLMMVLVADNAFGAAWPAFFMTYLDRHEEAIEVFGKVLRYFLTLYLTLCAGFFLFARPVVELLMAESFYPAAEVVGWVAFCSVLKCVYLIFLPGIYFERKLHLQTAIEWFAAVFCAGACWAFVPIYGLMGAVLAPVVGYAVLCVSACLVGARYLPIKIEAGAILSMFCIFGGVVVISGFHWANSPVVEALLRFFFYFGLCFLMWALFVKSRMSSIVSLVSGEK